jgi:hypothetical protein
VIDLARYGGRPTLVAVATMNVVTGLAAAAVLAPLSFGRDADAFRRGAIAIETGHIDPDFLYSPLAALVARPLTWLPVTWAPVVMALIGAAVLVAGILLETHGSRPLDRMLVAVAAFTFAPVVNELLLGQVTLLVAATLYPVVRRRDGLAPGIPFGIALALAPKPFLVPVLLWMLLRRPRALGGALATAMLLTAATVVVLGPEIHRQWLDTLAHAGRITRQGNLSLWTAGFQGSALVLAAAVLVASLWATVRSDAAGFVSSLFAGLLLAPYTLLYSASVLLLAVRPGLAISPRATRILALIANPSLFAAFVPWVVAGLGSCVAAARPPLTRSQAEKGTGRGDPPVPVTGRTTAP